MQIQRQVYQKIQQIFNKKIYGLTRKQPQTKNPDDIKANVQYDGHMNKLREMLENSEFSKKMDEFVDKNLSQGKSSEDVALRFLQNTNKNPFEKYDKQMALKDMKVSPELQEAFNKEMNNLQNKDQLDVFKMFQELHQYGNENQNPKK